MAPINYLLLVVLVITPFVENAPSTKKNSEDELHTRLVFVDNDDNAISSSSRLITSSIAPLPKLKDEEQTISVTKSRHVIQPVSADTKYLVQERLTPTKMVDERQNWGIIIEEKDLPDEESYYNRPLSLPRNINTQVVVPEKQQPKVQATVLKSEVSNGIPKPSVCDMAVITCCTENSASEECFKSQNCFSVTKDKISSVCSKSSVTNTIETISKYYRVVLGK